MMLRKLKKFAKVADKIITKHTIVLILMWILIKEPIFESRIAKHRKEKKFFKRDIYWKKILG
jgi:hypothetical protein